MARLARLVVPGQAHHVIHRTVAGADAFPGAADLRLFKEALQRSTREHQVALHAYALRAGEVQFLATPAAADSLGRMMQALTRFYVAAFNRRHGRVGGLWQGRFRAAPVGGDEPLLLCMRYVDQTILRGMGALGAGIHGSSADAHTGGTVDALLSPVPSTSAYWQLGNTPFEREAAYRQLLQEPLAPVDVARVESSTLKGWALGTDAFLASIRPLGSRRLERGVAGRPARFSKGGSVCPR